ncbi:replication protein O [Marinobacter salinus]|uniref:Replication protein O n=1 Tax=Marinobacter salinus TaxID=1874317 RepID=A0A1D9GMK7_9GAMM|nr:replication protein O [Marinobacter salinus]AOY88630.1 replication protein O [Marinobacter salinus]
MSIIDLMARPIAFNRAFVDLGLGMCGAMMLSQSLYWRARTRNPDGWFYKSQKEWQEETGMTRREQETARRRLTAAGFLEEQRKGVPARLHFRVNIEAVEAALEDVSSRMAQTANQDCAPNENSSLAESANQVCTDGATSMAESANQECTEAPNRDGGKRQSITEITSETTTETTAERTSGPDRPDAPLPPSSETNPEPGTEPDRPDAAIQSGRFWGNQDDLDLAVWMWDQLAEQLGPDKPRAPNFSRWANTIRLMREQDGREHRHIRVLWDWARQHEKFWAANVQSPDKLREKWSQLAMQRRSERRKPTEQAGIDRAAELRRIHEQRSNSQQGVTYEH